MTKKHSIYGDLTFWRSLALQTCYKFSPLEQYKNPVMFLVFLGAWSTTIACLFHYSPFNLQIAIWLWLTSLYANFAEALAEGRSKAQADALKKTKTKTVARKILNNNEISVAATELRCGDIFVCESGDIIPADGEVVDGIATVDESAITGESAPVIRESGGDRSAVTGGTRVISDKIIVRVTADPGNSFLDKMILLIEGAKRQKTPNEKALNVLLVSLSVIFVLSVITLPLYIWYSEQAAQQEGSVNLTVPIAISLIVCLIPTTISGLLSAIGIGGIDRLMRRNVLAKSGRSVEAAGDIDVLLLDKTGTITLGNRVATSFLPVPGKTAEELADAAQLSSLADQTPEGRSIVVLAKEQYGLRGREVAEPHAKFIPFSANTSMSGVDFVHGEFVQRSIRKGSVEAIRKHVEENGGKYPAAAVGLAEQIARSGGTPIVVADGAHVLGVVHLKDVVKGGIKDRFAQLRKMGIRTIMITGDNSLTAAAIAAEAGVDDFMAEARPQNKLERIRAEQANGHMVAMIGDGTNDAPALAQADVGVAMHTGTQAAREAGNMVDLDSNPTKLLDIVETGKQILMTRGALTTFSMATDIAKYFAILPTMFGQLYSRAGGTGPLSMINIMHLQSPETATLSAVIFNAIVILALLPLALRGVAYKPHPATTLLRNNLLIYGGGGLIAPFVGIKIIDMLINYWSLI